MDSVALIAISGVIMGSVYGLIGMLFTLIYIATRVINFAQGDFVMVGSLLSVLILLTLKIPFVVGIALIACLLAILGIITERIAINPLFKRNAPVFTMIIATFAVAIMLSSGASLAGGAKSFYVPSVFSVQYIALGKNVSIMPQELLIIGVNVLIFVAVWLFLKKTMAGMALRASGQNQLAAKLMGINVNRMVMVTFGICSGLSGIIGVLLVPLTGAFAFMGLAFSIKGFIAAVIGGLQNPFAAIVGGLVVGLTEAFLSAYVSTAYTEAIVYSILFAIFIVKPAGLVAR
jgi:branched-chain amino acid transport system permease protein